MLRELVEKNHVCFAQSAQDWQEAVRLSCAALVRDGSVDPGYADQIIDCVRKYGAYMVLFPGVAMPHAQESTELVHATEVSFLRLSEPVLFDPDNPDSGVDLLFTICSEDPQRHLEQIQQLMEILGNEQLIADLHGAESAEDLLALADRYGL